MAEHLSGASGVTTHNNIITNIDYLCPFLGYSGAILTVRSLMDSWDGDVWTPAKETQLFP